MKQIISFKKDLPFKTKVSDITSISLEREIKVEEEGIVSGVFHITGDYKMNEGSITREEFSFDLPFDITLDPRYDISTVKSDIDDFSYDLEDDNLKVDIELYIEAEYKEDDYKEITLDISDNDSVEERNIDKEEDKEEESVIEEAKEEPVIEEKKEDRELEREDIMEINNNDLFKEIPSKEIKVNESADEKIATDLFSNLDETETYVTYYVYIVKEDDNIDKIMNKYGVTKEDLEDYNDLSNIKIGDKIIIPKCNEKWY